MLVSVPKTAEQGRAARGSAAADRVRPKADVSARLCAVQRDERPKDELIRFVAGPDGKIVPDLKQNLPGRGVWISANKATVAKGVAQNVFSRSLKARVSADPNLPNLVDDLLKQRILGLASLASKAAAIVAGFTKTLQAIERDKVAVLVHASDAAPDGCDKLSRKYIALGTRSERSQRIVALLTTSELSLALGRTNVVHAGLTDPGMAGSFLTAVRRLERYRDSGPAAASDTQSETSKRKTHV